MSKIWQQSVRRSSSLLLTKATRLSDFLVEDEHGRLVTCPSTSPENVFLKELDLLKGRNIPIVAVDQPIRDPFIDSVRIDNVTAAKEVVTHLIANGYRRIAVISGPKSTPTANERVLGYRQALQEAGIEHDPVLEQRGPFVEETSQNAVHTLLDLAPPVDAIFATNNRLTVGALRTLYMRRKHVPDDIALVGFDLIHWAVPDAFSITTVLQPAYEIGRTAANRLIQRIRQPDAPRQEIILPHQLLIGDSSRPRRQPGTDTSSSLSLMDFDN